MSHHFCSQLGFEAVAVVEVAVMFDWNVTCRLRCAHQLHFQLPVRGQVCASDSSGQPKVHAAHHFIKEVIGFCQLDCHIDVIHGGVGLSPVLFRARLRRCRAKTFSSTSSALSSSKSASTMLWNSSRASSVLSCPSSPESGRDGRGHASCPCRR